MNHESNDKCDGVKSNCADKGSVSESKYWTLCCYLLIAAVAVLIVQLQFETTNEIHDPPFDYLLGLTFDQYMTDNGVYAFFRCRLLMRYVILGVSSVTGMAYVDANVFLQTLILAAALIVFYNFLLYFVPHALSFAGVFLMAAWIPWSFLSFGRSMSYVYDFPALLFMVIGLLCLVRRKDLLLPPLVTLATLNKETIVILIPLYMLLRFDEWRTKRYMLIVITAIVGFLTSFILPRLLMPESDGGYTNTFTLEYLDDNFTEVLFFVKSGFYQNIYLVMLPHVLALIGWKKFPRELKVFYLVTFLTFMPAQLILGSIVEVRIFQEILPLAIAGLLLQFPNESR